MQKTMAWTNSEVMKLIESVSVCGVGQWTELKRELFSSCLHSTSVDLKIIHGHLLIRSYLLCFLGLQDIW
jgi:hypothetical protein